jgi:HAD superfamily hydrolase (TIGR01509 family)
MNIIIPLCGKGERFKKAGFNESKPLVKVFDKSIIFYVLDNLYIKKNDEVFIFYNSDLGKSLCDCLYNRYHNKFSMHLVSIYQYTKGAAETIKLGIEKINDVYKEKINNRVSVCLDKIRNIANLHDGGTINTINTNKVPVYSYITKNNDNLITSIREKEKISDIINTGVYFFKNLKLLYNYCNIVSSDKSMFMNGECYISCALSKMLQDGLQLYSIEISNDFYYNLGTPEQCNEFIMRTHAFLFDLDGTIVISDHIYYEVWREILDDYNIVIDESFYKKYIFGNTDFQVLNTVLYNINETIENLSRKKDEYFLKHKSQIKLATDIKPFLKSIKSYAHKIGIVTNCNRKVAEDILNYFELTEYIDCLIIGNECERSKPYHDPYLKACEVLNISNDKVIIFEDSKSGLLSAKGIFPKKIIAIDIGYDSDIYQELGVTHVIKNFEELKVENLLENKTNEDYYKYEKLKNNIYTSLQKNKLSDEHIKDIVIDQTKLKGGYISDVIGISIISELNTYYLVLKLENSNESFLSKMAHNLGLYEREYYFYNNISQFVPIRIPKFYGIVYEGDKKIGILLENMYKTSGEILPNLNINNNQCIEHTLKIVEECAKLHGKFYGKDLKKIFPHLLKHNDKFFSSWKEFTIEKWSVFQDKWKFILKESHIKIIKKSIDHFEKIQAYLSKGKLTLCHGDVKTLNMFFEKFQYHDKTIYEPIFIDWQYIVNGKGVQDIVFFLIESFNIEKIKQNHTLIKEYYYIKCLENGMTDYSKEEYIQDFTCSILHFPLFVSMWFGTLSQEDLIDKNFPYFFIQKFLCVIDLYEEDLNSVLDLINVSYS